MDCSICCENINKGSRKEVKCPYCDYVICLICFKRYLMESSKLLPDCMACHKELQLEFISKVTPKSFHNNTYRKKRGKDLLSQEKSLLPNTQHLVEERMLKIANEKEISELLEEEKYLKFRIKEIKQRIRYLRNPTNIEKDMEKKKQQSKFIMGCPNEDCRGFLSQAWKCGTCGMYACSKCRAIKNGRDDNDHKCDEDDVKTYEMLKQETKPCPKCAVPIYKLSGCDQMWCIECHTPFSWRTGEIVSGVIHNPHFYQWQREKNNGVAPRVPGDMAGIGCGGLPWIQTVNHILSQRKHTFKYMEECHRVIGHIRGIVLPRYPINIGMLDNTDLRVQYLCKEINEIRWESILSARLKKSEKNREVNQILEMFIITITDLFNTYVTGSTNDLEKEANTLRFYVNKELASVENRYNNKVPFVDNRWRCM